MGRPALFCCQPEEGDEFVAKGKNTVSVVYDIAAPLAEKLGLTIWDVRFVKEGASWYLRVFIDKDGGVDINDCVDMTHALNDPLDEADPIDKSYCLEVCSPGLERELVRDFHFEKMMGRKITVRLIRPDENGQRDFKGTLCGYENGKVSFKNDNDEIKTFEKSAAAYIKLDDFEN